MLSAFVGHGWQGIVVQIVCLVVTVLTWMPFVLMANKQFKKEQQEQTA
ncbi:MAG: hypothetical protein SOX68_08265 [Faecalicoccus sp.]|nr:hypothetical protein [Faecalicoccus sp.]MDY4278939.1 hypothetical protein [Faecalicoccus sp.]